MSLTGLSGEVIASERERFNGLGTAAARHARRRAGAIVTAGRFVGSAGLRPDKADHAGRAERQQRDDDGEGKPAHVGQV